MVVLISWLGTVKCGVALAIDRKGAVSVEFCVLSRFLQIFIDRNFLKRNLLSWDATHEMIWPISCTHLGITLSLMTVVRVSVWIFSLKASNSDWFSYRWAWVLVCSSVLCETFQISLRLLMEMNWLGDSLISQTLSSSDLGIDKSGRVCRVETKISVGQCRSFVTDLLQGCRAIGTTIEGVPFASFELIVVVSSRSESTCAVVFFRSKRWVRVTVRSNIYCSTVMVPWWTYGNFLHLCVPIYHLLVLRDLSRTEWLPLTRIGMLVSDILIVPSNVSVKTGSLRALLLSIAICSEIGVTAGLACTVVVLYVRGAHTVVELGLVGMWMVFHYMTHLTRQSLWKGLDFCWWDWKSGVYSLVKMFDY